MALTRDASSFPIRDSRLEIIEGSPSSPTDVEKSLHKADAVVHCLGIGGKGDGKPNSLVSDSVRLVLEQMRTNEVERIVCMSNVGAGGSGTWFYRRAVIPVFLPWLQPIVEDKNLMEAALQDSSVEWTSVRLPNIVSGPAKPVRVSENGKGIGLSITADSAAQFLLAQLDDDEWLRRTPSISN